jgi:hypothetical protein
VRSCKFMHPLSYHSPTHPPFSYTEVSALQAIFSIDSGGHSVRTTLIIPFLILRFHFIHQLGWETYCTFG